MGTHGAGHEFTGIDPGTDSACGILLMSLRSMSAGQGQAGEYAGGIVAAQGFERLGQRVGTPECGQRPLLRA